MKKIKKMKWAPVLLVVILLLTMACGGGGSDSSKNTESSDSSDGANNDSGADDSANDSGTDDSANDSGADDAANDSGTDDSANDSGADDSANDSGADDSANDSGADDSANDSGADDSDNGSGTDVTSIDGITFSGNGYFFIPRDGDRMEMQRYQTYEFVNLDLDPSVTEGTGYVWWSGTETVNSVETLRRYSSDEGFNGTILNIDYAAYIDNEHREYRHDFSLDTPSFSNTYLYDPYIPLPLDLVPGETFSHSYTENEQDGTEVNRVQMTITDVAYDSVTNHFDTYDDCIRYTIEYEYRSVDQNEVSEQEIVFWFCKGAGQVRAAITTDGEFASINILDTRCIYN